MPPASSVPLVPLQCPKCLQLWKSCSSLYGVDTPPQQTPASHGPFGGDYRELGPIMHGQGQGLLLKYGSKGLHTSTWPQYLAVLYTIPDCQA